MYGIAAFIAVSHAQFVVSVQRHNFGNYYWVLTNALWAVRFCNATCVVVQPQPHPAFQAAVEVPFNGSYRLTPIVALMNYSRLSLHIESPEPTMRDRLRITCGIAEAVRRSLLGAEPSVTTKFTSSDTLVAHIRSGDIFTTFIHESYWQPPLGFYQLAARGYARIAVCSQSYDNPTVRALYNWCLRTRATENCLLRVGQPLLQDIAFLMAAHNLAVGSGSFAVAIYALSARLRRVYYVERYFIGAVAHKNETRCGRQPQIDGVQIAYNMSQVTENVPWYATMKQVNALLLNESELTELRIEKRVKLL